ncbi:hypothetical protein MYK68_06945 [Gordonia sp. PP30]|uniref:hypothetical protein n=1 Tax=unclassified Gordonia (in: high G+C Gram-positive bacteria) TaxID=2657482 RepID=UPI001FFF45B2|nr:MULTISPECIES: hypothetical protein [unclassified Gordonia (in: high G+C Gram-positive bacteria)]UQE76311.1 hypothetical protein MYK68_06945 [Gordonia sp. PP30]
MTRRDRFSHRPALTGGPIGWLARLRQGRVFHPSGTLCTGYATIGDPVLPVRSGAVTLRLSKGLGTPRGLPDVVGVAVRLQTTQRTTPTTGRSATGAWDLLLAGPVRYHTGLPFPVPLPALTWDDIPLSSIQRFRYDGTDWRLEGRLLIPATAHGHSVPGGEPVPPGLDVSATVARLSHAPGVLALGAGDRAGRTRPLGVVNFTAAPRDRDIAFDPMRVRPPEIVPVPGWLDRVRRSAYRASRAGRGARLS